PKTSSAKIVAAAKKIVSKAGADALSMQAVAAAVGVRAPSLYKHFADRATLLAALRNDAAAHMRETLLAVVRGDDPRRGLRAIAEAQRTFALRSPHLYALIMDPTPGHDLSPQENEALVRPIVELMRGFGEPSRALDGARLLVAFVHGFATMENAGAFRM